ncbi:AIPR family protein [Breznakiellaceae bacterium SP9]
MCSKFPINTEKTKLECKDLNGINGCQSLTTIYRCSEDVRKIPNDTGYILFRFYEVPQKDLVDKISINTNSQSAVKPRDLRSNDRIILSLKRAYESIYPDGLLLNQKGMEIPGSIDKSKVVDVGGTGKNDYGLALSTSEHVIQLRKNCLMNYIKMFSRQITIQCPFWH